MPAPKSVLRFDEYFTPTKQEILAFPHFQRIYPVPLAGAGGRVYIGVPVKK